MWGWWPPRCPRRRPPRLHRLEELAHHGRRREVPLADRRVQRGDVAVPGLLGDRGQRLARRDPLDRQAFLAQRAGEGVLALLDRLLAPLLGEPRTDLVAGTRALDELQPVAAGTGALALGREDLDDVAVVEHALEGHELAVDPRSDTAVAHLGVDRVGEVDRRRPGGKGDHVALRREDETSCAPRSKRSESRNSPGSSVSRCQSSSWRSQTMSDVALARRAAVLLVLPVGGDAVLGPAVHRVGADLQLDRLSARTDDRRVQRLVHVELGHRDVVLEPPRHRVPLRVHGAQRRVAVADAVDQDTDAHEVVDVGEVASPHDHLLVDGVVVLRSTGDRRLDPVPERSVRTSSMTSCEEHLALRRPLGDQAADLVEQLRVQRREREVLELPLDRVHAQPVRERREDLQRLAGLALLLLRGQVARACACCAGGRRA